MSTIEIGFIDAGKVGISLENYIGDMAYQLPYHQ